MNEGKTEKTVIAGPGFSRSFAGLPRGARLRTELRSVITSFRADSGQISKLHRHAVFRLALSALLKSGENKLHFHNPENMRRTFIEMFGRGKTTFISLNPDQILEEVLHFTIGQYRYGVFDDLSGRGLNGTDPEFFKPFGSRCWWYEREKDAFVYFADSWDISPGDHLRASPAVDPVRMLAPVIFSRLDRCEGRVRSLLVEIRKQCGNRLSHSGQIVILGAAPSGSQIKYILSGVHARSIVIVPVSAKCDHLSCVCGGPGNLISGVESKAWEDLLREKTQDMKIMNVCVRRYVGGV